MRSRQLVILALVAVLVSSAAAARGWTGEPQESIFQFDFWGFSIAPEPVDLGDELELVGVLVPGTTWLPITLDFTQNEYTVYVHDLILAERFQSGPAIESHYSGGLADIYQDPSFNAPFTASTAPEDVPPLDPAVVPAHFSDGTLLVRMEFRNCITLFYPASGIGSVAYTPTELRVIAGSAQTDLQKKHMLVGWHMGGGFTDDPRYIPEGYGMRYDPLFRWENPLPVEPATWGRIKAAFRP